MNESRNQGENTLLVEGAKSYPLALLAIDEFVRQVHQLCRDAVESERRKINAALADKPDCSDMEELTNNWDKRYKPMTGYGETYIGQVINRECWSQSFSLYWIKSQLFCSATTTFKDKEVAQRVFNGFQEKKEMSKWQLNKNEIYLNNPVSSDETDMIEKLMRETIDEWCAAWQHVGGLNGFVANLQAT